MHVYLLEAAISYFNKGFKTNLKVNYNYNYKPHDDAAEIDKIMGVLAVERGISSKKASMPTFKMPPTMKVLTNRQHGNSQKLKCPKEHGLTCFRPPFRARFFGSNIYAIFTVKEKVKCFVCDKEIDFGTLDAHFQNNCRVFNPAPVSANMFAE